MDVKSPVIAIIGFLIATVLLLLYVVFLFRKNKQPASEMTVNVANTDLLLQDKKLKNSIIFYHIARTLLVLSLVGCIAVSFVMLARPYYVKKVHEQKYNRDIIICLDISSSVDELNLKLVKDLEDVVRSLSGERIGIVIFNTSSIVLSPLSDDYEYTIEQLENIRKAIKVCHKPTSLGDDYLYWNNFLYGGTLVGNAERGSSLIGDGLLGGLFAFPKDSEDRTKIIIFSTDNDANGEGYVNLTEAAEYCKNDDVTVFGIGTKIMYAKDREEMKAAMESTGGKFYLEEDAKTFHNIVDEIEAKSASLVEGRTVSKEVEYPEDYFKLLVFLFALSLVLTIVLFRFDLVTVILQIALVICIILTNVKYVQKAYLYQMGPDLAGKKKSNYNVLFVIDDTLSMLANDCEGDTERMTKLKQDLEYMIDELDGAKFSVITFNNDAMVLSPFNNNSEHTKNIIKSIYPLQELYAQGSSFNKPKQVMISHLKTTDGNTAVIFLSDGENTSEEQIESYGDIKGLINDGAVVGYGTKDGGTMNVKNMWDDQYNLIMDYDVYPFEPAVSRIDEKNLKKMADEMGVKYVNSSFDRNGLDSVIASIKPKLDIKEEKIKEDENLNQYMEMPENKGRFILIPLCLLLVLTTGLVVFKK